MNTIHLKYVDDLTLTEKIDMKTQRTTDPDRPQPDHNRSRTGHKLRNEKSLVMKQLQETKNYADTTNMRINFTKTKFMLFNPCTSKDFLPHVEVDNSPIELVEQTKLLGLVVTSELSKQPAQNTQCQWEGVIEKYG